MVGQPPAKWAPSPADVSKIAEITRDIHATDSATSQAVVDPLPGPLKEAFPVDGDGSIPVGPLRIRRVKAYDHVILEKLQSPLYRQLQEGRKPEDQRQEIAPTAEEAIEIVYQFSTPIREVIATLGKGREHFRQQAQEKIGIEYDYGLIIKGVEAAGIQVLRALSTAIGHQSAEKDDKDETTFFPAPSKDEPTASAGGRSTSVA